MPAAMGNPDNMYLASLQGSRAASGHSASSAVSTDSGGGIMGVFWMLLAPLFSLWNFVMRLLLGAPPTEVSREQATPTQVPSGGGAMDGSMGNASQNQMPKPGAAGYGGKGARPKS